MFMQPCSVPSNKMSLPKFINSDIKPRSCLGELLCSSPISQQWCMRSSSVIQGLHQSNWPILLRSAKFCRGFWADNVQCVHVYKRPECGYLDPAELSAPLSINSQLFVDIQCDVAPARQLSIRWALRVACCLSWQWKQWQLCMVACQTELASDFSEAVDNIDGGRNEVQFRSLLPKKFKCSCVLQSFKGGHRDILPPVLVWYPFETSYRRISGPKLWLRTNFCRETVVVIS